MRPIANSRLSHKHVKGSANGRKKRESLQPLHSSIWLLTGSHDHLSFLIFRLFICPFLRSSKTSMRHIRSTSGSALSSKYLERSEMSASGAMDEFTFLRTYSTRSDCVPPMKRSILLSSHGRSFFS